MRRRILDASIRVLREEGALGFTTTKVADEAGISVGSLYQYFPNKQAIVVALHDDDIEHGWDTANHILEHGEWSPRRKLHELTRWFFASEAEEAQTFGVVAGNIEVFLQHTSARQRNIALSAAISQRCAEFIGDSTTRSWSHDDLQLAADLLFTTVESLAKATASRSYSAETQRIWADSTANMLANQLGFPDD
jgi:AcrR family transcriptional regulator